MAEEFLHTTLTPFAGMAELADALDLGSSGKPCRFDPCYPHQPTVSAPNYRVATSKIRTSLHDGGVRICLYSLHQRQVAAPNYRVATSKIRTSSHDGGVRICLYSLHQPAVPAPRPGCRHKNIPKDFVFGDIFVISHSKQLRIQIANRIQPKAIF